MKPDVENLTCRELIEFLMDYIDDELAPAESRAFDQHLAICEDCAAYLDSYRQTSKLAVVACANDDLPEDIPEDLISAILAASKAR